LLKQGSGNLLDGDLAGVEEGDAIGFEDLADGADSRSYMENIFLRPLGLGNNWYLLPPGKRLYRRGAEEQRSRGAEEQRSRGAEEQRSRGAEEQWR